MGVVTFFLLSGTYPFLAPNPEELKVKILSCDYDFDDKDWKGISRNAKKFIEKLIEPNVDQRMTCEQALAHPWI